MKDRLVFEKIMLDNGITVYAKPFDVPFAVARLVIPIGSAHNTGEILPGTAHFLEHITFQRSRAFPEPKSFGRLVSDSGGYLNASTSMFETEFQMNIPTAHFAPAWNGFVSQIFETIFVEADIAHERGIIRDERNRKGKFYPGATPLGYYLNTEYQKSDSLPVNQIFGSDEDLANTTPRTLQALHQFYPAQNAHLVIGGSYDLKLVCETLSQIETRPCALAEAYSTRRWVRQEFHTKEFAELSQMKLDVTSLRQMASVNRKELIIMSTIRDILNDSVHGPLHTWLRHERGEVYGIKTTWFTGHNWTEFETSFTLDTHAQVAMVRAEWRERVRTALADQKALERFLAGQRNKRVFFYQKLEDIISYALDNLEYFGKIYSEEENEAEFREFITTETLLQTFDEFMRPEYFGEFCALPKS